MHQLRIFPGTPALHTNPLDSRDGFLPVLSPREAVPKLRIGEFVQPPSRRHTEVPPNVLAAAEVQLLHCPRAGLETLGEDRAEDMEKPGLRLMQSKQGRGIPVPFISLHADLTDPMASMPMNIVQLRRTVPRTTLSPHAGPVH